MKRQDDGSVILDANEAAALAGVLENGRELCDQMEAHEQQSWRVEHKLLTQIEFLEELGVSADELTGKLDQRPRSS